MRIVLFVIAILLCGPVAADERAELAAQVEAAGSYKHPEQRNDVVIDGCTMILTVWRPDEVGAWLLWSEFVFDMRGVSFGKDTKTGVLFTVIEQFTDGPAAFVFFNIADPFEARHEKGLFRNPKPPYAPSPRPGGFVYQTKTAFFTILYGEDAAVRAAAFTGGFSQYADRYCRTTS